MFARLLVANRGEIAVRIIRACRDLGISPVAVYSEADREALHVKLSDQAHYLGPPPASESYLVIERIIDAAKKSGAEAVHPGYGFLAENGALAEACEDSELVFVGPSAASMELMGDKIASRATAQRAGIPVVPGSKNAVQSPDQAAKMAAELGYPVMLKASAGGGGKGLRLARDEAALRSEYETARGEAESSFSDPTLFIEKFLPRPRHIEVQLLGDLHSNLIHLGERECSIQRRHQKVVEECPSPLVHPKLREKLGEAALAVARAAGYYNAGTVEFLVSGEDFYFLEMNTRLQVEHPVTELVTGIDLVREQILVAAGEKLAHSQADIQLEGAAIECRIYAEDPRNNFVPSPGRITTLFEPSGPGIRNDSGIYAGASIPLYYDPLISKLIAHGRDRDQAIARMRRALGEYKIWGVQTTIPFFEALLSHPEFEKGHLHTQFIEEHGIIDRLVQQDESLEIMPLLAAALHYFLQPLDRVAAPEGSASSGWKQSARPFPYSGGIRRSPSSKW
ncbi:MAG: acetyl-CoA carboxylase biotin carboxylase subunit [Acidobacteriota bacterium]